MSVRLGQTEQRAAKHAQRKFIRLPRAEEELGSQCESSVKVSQNKNRVPYVITSRESLKVLRDVGMDAQLALITHVADLFRRADKAVRILDVNPYGIDRRLQLRPALEEVKLELSSFN